MSVFQEQELAPPKAPVKGHPKTYYLLGALFFVAALALAVFGSYQYKAVQAEMGEIQALISQEGFKKEKEDKVQKLLDEQEKQKDANKEQINKLSKAFPVYDATKIKTNVVRLFDNIAYNWHAPQKAEPFILQDVVFEEAQQRGNVTVVPMKITLSCSEANLEQLLYFLESTGYANDKDAFDQEIVDSLEGILNQKELETLRNLIDSDYTIKSLMTFRKLFLDDRIKRKLIDQLLAKPLLLKKYQEQVDPKYYPAPLMSLEDFTIEFLKTEESKEVLETEGEIKMEATIFVHTQSENMLNEVLQ